MKFFKSFLSSLSILDSMTHKTSLNQTCYVKYRYYPYSVKHRTNSDMARFNQIFLFSLLVYKAVNILGGNGSVKSVYQLISAQTDFLSNHSQKDETNVCAQCGNCRIILPLRFYVKSTFVTNNWTAFRVDYLDEL